MAFETVWVVGAFNPWLPIVNTKSPVEAVYDAVVGVNWVLPTDVTAFSVAYLNAWEYVPPAIIALVAAPTNLCVYWSPAYAAPTLRVIVVAATPVIGIAVS